MNFMLAEMTAKAATAVNPLRLKLSDFPALAKTNGSIRIGSSPVVGDFPLGLYFPIVITRGVGTTFYAVSSECTHASCVVDPANSKTGIITCPCHGSTFDRTGRRLAGQARSSLTSYAAKYDAATGFLTVGIEFDTDQNLSIEHYEILPNGTRRIALEWTAFQDVNYEIRFLPSINGLSVVAGCSLTPDGPATETLIVGPGDVIRVYVDRPATGGFFQIAFNYSEV